MVSQYLQLTCVPSWRTVQVSEAAVAERRQPVVVQRREFYEVLDAPVPCLPSSRISDVSLQKGYLELHWRYPPLVPTGRTFEPVLAYRVVCASWGKIWGLDLW